MNIILKIQVILIKYIKINNNFLNNNYFIIIIIFL